jgi:predicted nucleic acid-binding protein
MKVYLDNCSFNRPFDNQIQLKIRLETEAKLFIQSKILSKKIELVWSYILEFENMQNPFAERKQIILEWKEFSKETVSETPNILVQARKLTKSGLKAKDALHVACAMEANADAFITTDLTILKKLSNFEEIKVINPLQFLTLWEDEE